MLQALDPNAWPKALEAALNQEDIKNSLAVVLSVLVKLGPTGSYDMVLKHRTEAATRYGERDPHVAIFDLFRVTIITFYLQSQLELSVPSNHSLRVDTSRVDVLAREALAVNEAAYGPVHPRIFLSLLLLGTGG